MPQKRSQDVPEPEEATPLLRDGNPPRKETPLPITQIAVLLMLQLTEPITSRSINPYINQVRSSILMIQIINDVRLSLSAGYQSLVVTKRRSDTTQG